MSFDPVKDIEEFHKKFGIEYDGKPRALPEEFRSFRVAFLAEELKEYSDANFQLDQLIQARSRGHMVLDMDITSELVQAMDGLIDLVYVALGNAHV